MRQKILVSYHAKKGLKNIVGNVDCFVGEFPVTMEIVRLIEKDISKTNKFDNTVLLNIIPLAESITEP